ncbi:hypothetical protein SK128_004969 [Halocaridina rubra]|uniref:Ig-like domain-containing protein n=1 Tax=Halocaridina rubra TaxID=373956 RepID=A0AAN8WZ81_HALRR
MDTCQTRIKFSGFDNKSIWLPIKMFLVLKGPPERHIQEGSVLAITCVVRHPPHSAQQVLWFHGKENIDYDSPRGGISIQTEKSNRKTVSKLMLATINHNDNGEYSCTLSDLPPAVVSVHVLAGQLHQPVQQRANISSAVTASVSSALLVMLMVTLACVRCKVSN